MNASKQELIDTINNLADDEYIRIRKLTVKEVGRLMDVDDENIEKIMSACSKSQCYKQFGNSIVVACMEGMFENLFYPNKELDNKPQGYQFNIFDYL